MLRVSVCSMEGEPSLLAEPLHIESICLAVTSATFIKNRNKMKIYS